MNQNEEPRSKPRKKAKSQSGPNARRSANRAKKKAKGVAATNGSQDTAPQAVLDATVEEPATATSNDGPEASGTGGMAKVSDLLNVPSFRKMVIDRLVKKLG